MNPQNEAAKWTEMEAAIERLREEIRKLKEERDALEQGNLDLYRKLTTPDF